MGLKIFEFQYLWFFFQKNEYFLGKEEFVDVLRGHQNTGHSRYRMGIYIYIYIFLFVWGGGGAYISNIFGGMPDVPYIFFFFFFFFFGGGGGLTVDAVSKQAYV